jgi:tetratricopeptide (TPR) repeat protein
VFLLAIVSFFFRSCCLKIVGRAQNGAFAAPVILSLLSLLLLLNIATALGQTPSPEPSKTAILQGYVRDSSGKPVANATVFLQLSTAASPSQITHTSSEGAYRFAALGHGDYTLRAEMNNYDAANSAAVIIAAQETKTIDLTLVSRKTAAAMDANSGKSAANKSGEKVATQTLQFFDEPQFTVAGVTAATGSAGHGSDPIVRTTEALARATVSLSTNDDKGSRAQSDLPSVATEDSLRHAVAQNPNDSALHHRLADLEEKLGNPLEAVRQYQRAAELDPSEANLFDWGTELLTHRALEPAAEVFANGNKLFPQSVRMLVALGVTSFARGSHDQAAECLERASDLVPDDPAPYLFLGRMQSVEIDPPKGSAGKFARFAERQPNNALANYYLAVSISKRSEIAADGAKENSHDPELLSHEEFLLLKSIHLDPKLGAAYLQLGTLYTQRSDFARAISEYQRAIEVSSEASIVQPNERPDETNSDEMVNVLTVAHYRLAQAYLQMGDKTKAQEELQLHSALTKKQKADSDRQRQDIQEFIISMRNQDSAQPKP